jgi:hypothetical protein
MHYYPKLYIQILELHNSYRFYQLAEILGVGSEGFILLFQTTGILTDNKI